ncbi:unnamed protein product [Trypanosoma congolense IL3000]|uniref:WGS project CAEQ00000000 data, annotated contig 1516 n=1 Tax=Trypanosoma congolense (strain IL3000) TaxID=1068625 RepID=F9W6S4_TRYCI|nr:unnamed protein product [Trypanosoma congolense IL3000]
MKVSVTNGPHSHCHTARMALPPELTATLHHWRQHLLQGRAAKVSWHHASLPATNTARAIFSCVLHTNAHRNKSRSSCTASSSTSKQIAFRVDIRRPLLTVMQYSSPSGTHTKPFHSLRKSKSSEVKAALRQYGPFDIAALALCVLRPHYVTVLTLRSYSMAQAAMHTNDMQRCSAHGGSMPLPTPINQVAPSHPSRSHHCHLLS